MQPCKRAKQILTNWNSTDTSAKDLFIPKSQLPRKDVTDWDSVHEILRCHNAQCDNCKADYRFICSGRQIKIHTEGNVDRILTSATALFALFIRIGHPLLIIPLLEHGRDDTNTLDTYCAGSFKFPKIQENYWPECQHRSSEDTENFSKEVAVLLRQHISIFFRPSFRDKEFHVVNEKLRLPIYGEREIGHGSYGKVVAFKIFSGHNDLVVSTISSPPGSPTDRATELPGRSSLC